MMVSFTEWPKTTRLFRDIVITEKLDGTNSAIRIERMDQIDTFTRMSGTNAPTASADPIAVIDGLGIWAQSRSRMIFPHEDNFGFARWVHTNAEELVTLFDTGIHFGEWWGKGIQRNYGIDEKRFSLFNTAAHSEVHQKTDLPIQIAPVLYEGVFRENAVKDCLNALKTHGSVAVDGFMNPEGICIYHTQSRIVQKVTLDNNDAGKWETV